MIDAKRYNFKVPGCFLFCFFNCRQTCKWMGIDQLIIGQIYYDSTMNTQGSLNNIYYIIKDLQSSGKAVIHQISVDH